MLKYVLRRLLLLIPMLLGASVIIFLLLHYGGNDPAMSYLRLSNIPPTDEALAQARIHLGLDQPLLIQYGQWLFKAVQLDFGRSYVTGAPVVERLLYYLPNTLYLAGVAVVLTILISVPLGVAAAVYKGRWPDHLTRIMAYIGVSSPSFWLGFMLMLFFAVKLQWLPSMGIGGFQYVIMPAFSIAFMSACINIRLIRGNMLEQMNNRTILYAHMRGVKKSSIIGRHMLKNSLLPVITALGMSIGEILGGSVIAEVIFSWPGVGSYAVSALLDKDFPVMQCYILMMTVIFVLCNLVVDILYAVVDPRIRLDAGGKKHA